MISRSCLNCGSDYFPYRDWQKFCSPACRNQHYERYVRHSCADALKALDDEEDEKDVDEKEVKNEKSAEG